MEITTIKDLVREFGGAKSVAEMMHVQPAAVYMVVNRDSIPFRWRIVFYQEAKRRKIKVAPQLLGAETS